LVNDDLVPRFKSDDSDWHGHGRTGGYLRECLNRLEQSEAEDTGWTSSGGDLLPERTHEFGSYIIEAMETNHPLRINGNVANRGLITNLPQGCCVEVPCLVDGNGIQPTAVGELPRQLAALMRTNINVQELAVEAALTGNPEAIYHAVMLDPLTAAVCTLPQIRAMVDELLAAQARWLPEFQR
jgi:alpha-galactosidase